MEVRNRPGYAKEEVLREAQNHHVQGAPRQGGRTRRDVPVVGQKEAHIHCDVLVVVQMAERILHVVLAVARRAERIHCDVLVAVQKVAQTHPDDQAAGPQERNTHRDAPAAVPTEEQSQSRHVCPEVAQKAARTHHAAAMKLEAPTAAHLVQEAAQPAERSARGVGRMAAQSPGYGSGQKGPRSAPRTGCSPGWSS